MARSWRARHAGRPRACQTPDRADRPGHAAAAPTTGTEDEGVSGTEGLIRCDQCGEEVPAVHYCVRCGDPLEPERRRGRSGRLRDTFAAAPDERAGTPNIVSTVFPALPRAHMRTFRVALAVGVAVVLALATLGLYPLAIVAGALLVPLLAVIYVYDVDVYEDEPLPIIGLTLAWGALAGIGYTLAVDALLPSGLLAGAVGSLARGGGPDLAAVVLRGLALPVVAGALMALGPAALMTQRRFNDVLDGATFGVSSAVAFTGAQTLVAALGFLEAGLRPTGDPVPWVARLAGLALVQPLVAAGAVGGFVGVLWLRHRAPVRDRGALGPLGRPVVAGVAGAALLAGQALAVELLDAVLRLVLLVPLAGAALLWLRRVLHVGLLQEAHEVAIGPRAPCPDCGRETAWHSYCGECGVAFASLPKDPRADRPDGGGRLSLPRPAQRARIPDRAIAAIFGVAFVGSLVLAGALVTWLSRDLGRPDCPDPGLPCPSRGLPAGGLLRDALPRARPAPGAHDGHPFADRTTHRDATTGFELEYDPVIWEVAEQDDGFLLLVANGGAAAIVIDAVASGELGPDDLAERRRGIWRERFLAVARDDEPSRRLLGTPILGHRAGVGELLGGSLDAPTGPRVPVSIALLAASDEAVTVSASVLADAQVRDAAFTAADSVLNSLTWPSEARVGAIGPGAPPASPSSVATRPVSAVARAVDPAAPVEVGLVLRGRDPDALAPFLADLHDPRSGAYRAWIDAAEFGRRFGLAPDAEHRLRDALAVSGLEVTAMGPQRALMRVRGSAADVGRLLDVRIERLERPDGGSHLAADRAPTIPPVLRESVVGVAGLDRSLPVSMARASVARAAAAQGLPSRGLRPHDLAVAYGIDALHEAGLRGEGTTVAILQFGPDTDADLAVFDATFGIDGPLPERIAVGTGLGVVPDDFAQEATLDTQVVRAVAPGATILVYGVPPELGIAGGIDAIVGDGRAQVISLSYGKCDVVGEWVPVFERELGRLALAAAAASGVTLFAASGDWGAFSCHAFDTTDHRETVFWPSCMGDVVSVGGTHLEVGPDGSHRRETGWQSYLSTAGTGGGASPSDPRPSWQVAAGLDPAAAGGRRQCPDVAASADPDTGYLIHFTDPRTGEGGWQMVGGTSAAAPFWAGAMALVQQAAAREGIDRIGFLAPTLYRIAERRPDAFRDVTRGGNLVAPAGPGWDAATGLGSPDLPVLAEAILEELRAESADEVSP
jgi:subtilisin family serine protease